MQERWLIEEVVDKWKLSHDKISVIITDIGSKIVAAFHRRVLAIKKRRECDDECKDKEEELEDYEVKVCYKLK